MYIVCGNNISSFMLTCPDDNSCDRCVGIETSLDDLSPTEEGVSLVSVGTVSGGVLGEWCLGHRDTLTCKKKIIINNYGKLTSTCTRIRANLGGSTDD